MARERQGGGDGHIGGRGGALKVSVSYPEVASSRFIPLKQPYANPVLQTVNVQSSFSK